MIQKIQLILWLNIISFQVLSQQMSSPWNENELKEVVAVLRDSLSDWNIEIRDSIIHFQRDDINRPCIGCVRGMFHSYSVDFEMGLVVGLSDIVVEKNVDKQWITLSSSTKCM